MRLNHEFVLQLIPMNRRVLLVVRHLEAGGVETHLFRCARELIARGWSVNLIATVRPGVWFTRAAENGINAVCLPMSPFVSRRSHARKIHAYMRRLEPGVVVVNDDLFVQGSLALLPEHVVAIPVIHNHSESVYRIGCSNERAWNVLVAVGPRIRDVAVAMLPGRPVEFIPYGVEVPAVSEENREREAADGLRICMVGRIVDEQKGVFLVPEILKRLEFAGCRYSLTVIGDGGDRAALVDKLTRAGLIDRVTFLGLLPPGEPVYRELNRAHVLLLPSYYEGLPIAFLEAMACGCVPVASRLPGITEGVVEHGRTGWLCEVGDVDGIARVLRGIELDRTGWLQASQSAKAMVAANFSTANMGRAYNDLFERSMAGAFPTPIARRCLSRYDASLLPWKAELPEVMHRGLASAKRGVLGLARSVRLIGDTPEVTQFGS